MFFEFPSRIRRVQGVSDALRPAKSSTLVSRQSRPSLEHLTGREEAAALMNGGFPGSDGMEQPELGQGGHPVIQADLLDDLAVLELQDGRTGELHLAPGVCGQ